MYLYYFLLKHAFEDLKVEKIHASCRYENHQSKRVLEKLGFKYFCDKENTDIHGNETREMAMFIEKE